MSKRSPEVLGSENRIVPCTVLVKKLKTDNNNLQNNLSTMPTIESEPHSSKTLCNTGISKLMSGLMLNQHNLPMLNQTVYFSALNDNNFQANSENNMISTNIDLQNNSLPSKPLLNCDSSNSPMLYNNLTTTSLPQINKLTPQNDEKFKFDAEIRPSKYVSFKSDNIENNQTVVFAEEYDSENDDALSVSSQKTIPFDMEDYDELFGETYKSDVSINDNFDAKIQNKQCSNWKLENCTYDKPKDANNSSLVSLKRNPSFCASINETEKLQKQNQKNDESTSDESLLIKRTKSKQFLSVDAFSSLPATVYQKVDSQFKDLTVLETKSLSAKNILLLGSFDFENFKSESEVIYDAGIKTINNNGVNSELLYEKVVSRECDAIDAAKPINTQFSNDEPKYNENIPIPLIGSESENVESVSQQFTYNTDNNFTQNTILFGPYDYEGIESQSFPPIDDKYSELSCRKQQGNDTVMQDTKQKNIDVSSSLVCEPEQLNSKLSYENVCNFERDAFDGESLKKQLSNVSKNEENILTDCNSIVQQTDHEDTVVPSLCNEPEDKIHFSEQPSFNSEDNSQQNTTLFGPYDFEENGSQSITPNDNYVINNDNLSSELLYRNDEVNLSKQQENDTIIYQKQENTNIEVKSSLICEQTCTQESSLVQSHNNISTVGALHCQKTENMLSDISNLSNKSISPSAKDHRLSPSLKTIQFDIENKENDKKLTNNDNRISLNESLKCGTFNIEAGHNQFDIHKTLLMQNSSFFPVISANGNDLLILDKVLDMTKEDSHDNNDEVHCQESPSTNVLHKIPIEQKTSSTSMISLSSSIGKRKLSVDLSNDNFESPIKKRMTNISYAIFNDDSNDSSTSPNKIISKQEEFIEDNVKLSVDPIDDSIDSPIKKWITNTSCPSLLNSGRNESQSSNENISKSVNSVSLQESTKERANCPSNHYKTQISTGLSNLDSDRDNFNDNGFAIEPMETAVSNVMPIYSFIDEMKTPNSSPGRHKDYLNTILNSPSPQKSNDLSKISESSLSDVDLDDFCKTNKLKSYLSDVLSSPKLLLSTVSDDSNSDNFCKTNKLKSYLADVLSSPKSVKSINSHLSCSSGSSPIESVAKRKANESMTIDDDINENTMPQKRQKLNELESSAIDTNYIDLTSQDDSNDIANESVILNSSTTNQTLVTEEDFNIVKKERDNLQNQIDRIENIWSTFGTILPDQGLSIRNQIDKLNDDLKMKNEYFASLQIKPIAQKRLFPIFERFSKIKKEAKIFSNDNITFDHSYTKMEDDNKNDYHTINSDFMKLFVKHEFLHCRLTKGNTSSTSSMDLAERIAVLNQQLMEKSCLLNKIQPKRNQPIALQYIGSFHSENLDRDDDDDDDIEMIEIRPDAIDLTTNLSSMSSDTNDVDMKPVTPVFHLDDELESKSEATNSINNNTTLKDCSQLLKEKNQITLQLNNLQRIAQNYGSNNQPIALLQHINKLNDEIEKINGILATLNMLKNKNAKPKISTNRNSWAQIVAEADDVKCAKNQNSYEFNLKKRLTFNRLEQLHNSMKKCPTETQLTDTPEGLRVELLDHQKYSMTWMKWRETQKPCGGILADDMGLGKTLTMIALVLAKKPVGFDFQSNMPWSDDDEDEYIAPSTSASVSKKRISTPNGGTLVVCPASIINQWEQEVKQRTERDLLSVYVFHGPKRENRIDELVQFDIVVTTYALVSRGAATKASFFFFCVYFILLYISNYFMVFFLVIRVHCLT